MRSITNIIQAAVRNQLESNRERDNRRGPQPAWYPSTVGYGCDRKAVLNRAGVEENPLEDITLRKFWMGSAVHEALQALVEEALKSEEGLKFLGNELQVRDDKFKIAGRVDTLVEIDNVLEVWEYKSISSQAFKYGLPREDHIMQVGFYLTFPATPKSNGDNPVLFKYPLPARARLIYWSKDDARIQEYVITPEYTFSDGVRIQDKVTETITRLEAAYRKYMVTGTLPEPLPLMTVENGKTKEDWRVKYCGYRGTGKCCADE